VEVDDSYKSTIYHSIQNFPTLITNPYSVVNTRFTYTTSSGLIDVAVFGTNLTNKIYLTNGIGIGSLGYDEGYYSRPASGASPSRSASRQRTDGERRAAGV